MTVWQSAKLALVKIRYSLPFSAKKLVGSDLSGNLYFEEDFGQQFKPKRTIYYHDGKNHISQYNPNDIPIEWQGWLRHTRNIIPTLMELENNSLQKKNILDKAKQVAEKDLLGNKGN